MKETGPREHLESLAVVKGHVLVLTGNKTVNRERFVASINATHPLKSNTKI